MEENNESLEVLSETEEFADESKSNSKLVPVSESIRYRRRAQIAEKKNQSLEQQLAEARARTDEMAVELEQSRVEQKLMQQLVSAGSVDLEAAMLIAKSRIESGEDGDIEKVIEQMQKEKQYLFGGRKKKINLPGKNANARERDMNNSSVLTRAAQKASTTGNRRDLQEYLRLRRSIV